jgi:hypothetical protein
MNREDIISMAIKAGFSINDYGEWVGDEDDKSLESFAALVAAQEREACAQLAENGLLGLTIAKAIRARGDA